MAKASKASQGTGKTQNISAPHRPQTRRIRADPVVNVFVFFFFVVVVGLLNVDVLELDALKDGEVINLADFFSDGGLLFYSMTLVGGSVYTVLSSPQRKRMHPYDILIYCACLAVGLIVVALVSSNYTQYIANNKQYKVSPNFFLIQIWIAIFSSALALIITFVVERLACVPPLQLDADNKVRISKP